ncbi:TPA: beta-aspartyl-peptidase [Klebsiella pneumoniae]|nr:beta-aspartyl-peptidase [Klebsiella pneumoniae]
MGKAVIAIHGGAGAISRAQMTPEREREYVAALSTIVESGQKMLAAGASALDAVTEAVRLLEECPLFNAGMGAVFTRDQTHELDACVMDGYSLQAGAVAGVKHLRNPVLAARLVLEKSPHVLLIGEGAENFAISHGMARVDNDLFSTPERLLQLQEAKAGGEIILDHHAAPLDERQKMGTVGAVAVSCTGTGEVFMRTLAAYDIAALMEYGQLSLYSACERVVMEKLPALGGSGGLIAVDREGNVVLPFNSEGMYRAWCYAGDTPTIGIYRE